MQQVIDFVKKILNLVIMNLKDYLEYKKRAGSGIQCDAYGTLIGLKDGLGAAVTEPVDVDTLGNNILIAEVDTTYGNVAVQVTVLPTLTGMDNSYLVGGGIAYLPIAGGNEFIIEFIPGSIPAATYDLVLKVTFTINDGSANQGKVVCTTLNVEAVKS